MSNQTMEDNNLDHNTTADSTSYLETLTTQVIQTLNNRDWSHPLLQQISPNVACIIQEHNTKHKKKGTQAYDSMMRKIFDKEGITTCQVLDAQATIHDGKFGQVWTLLKVRNANEILKDLEIETVIVYYWKRKDPLKGEWLMTGFEAINGVPAWLGSFDGCCDVAGG